MACDQSKSETRLANDDLKVGSLLRTDPLWRRFYSVRKRSVSDLRGAESCTSLCRRSAQMALCGDVRASYVSHESQESRLWHFAMGSWRRWPLQPAVKTIHVPTVIPSRGRRSHLCRDSSNLKKCASKHWSESRSHWEGAGALLSDRENEAGNE